MKLAAIRKQCMKANEIVIFETAQKQWIGTYSACWPVENVHLTRESVIELFDLTKKQADNMDINIVPMEDTGMMPDPYTAQEAVELMTVLHGGKRLRLMRCGAKIYAVDDEKIGVSCAEKEYRGVTIQRGPTGMPIAVVSNGFIHCGLIAPESQEVTDDILDRMGRIVGARLAIPDTEKEGRG